MNNDLISREALKEKLQGHAHNGAYASFYVDDIIDNAPTVETHISPEVLNQFAKYVAEHERPQGEWLYEEKKISYALFGYYVCSVCNEHYANNTNFCPNCGAKMGKGGAE